LAPWVLCAIGCSDDPLSRLQPKIEVDPAMVDFGAGLVRAPNTAQLSVKDVGAGILAISKVAIDPASAMAFSVQSAPTQVPPSGALPLVLVYEPARAHEMDQATLVIDSNDPKTPELRIPIQGSGGVQKIQVTPSMVDFGLVDEGQSPQQPVTIANVGKDDLVVSSVTFTSTTTELALAPGWTGGTLKAGTSTRVALVFTPADPGADHGVLAVVSNDELTPTVDVPVSGEANLAPHAIAWGCNKLVAAQIGCTGQPTAHRITASVQGQFGLDGRDSFDPQGAPIASFRWEVVAKPSASNALVFNSTDDRTLRNDATGEFDVDVVGVYDVRLIVKSARGLESLDRPESHVLFTPKDLEFSLSWDIPTDVDIHLVRPNGRLGDYGPRGAATSTGSDCSTYNRTPDWGPMTSVALDRDDVVGRGPEIISLDHPVDTTAPYRVYAHYCDSRHVGAPVDVTFQLYFRGMLVQTIPDPMSGRVVRLRSEDALEIAEVTWDATSQAIRTVIDTSTRTPTSAPGLCLLR
jgi:hypothetical protein